MQFCICTWDLQLPCHVRSCFLLTHHIWLSEKRTAVFSETIKSCDGVSLGWWLGKVSGQKKMGKKLMTWDKWNSHLSPTCLKSLELSIIPGRTFRRIATASASRRALLWERHQPPPLPWWKFMSWYSFACWPFVQFHDKIDKHPRWKGVDIDFLVYIY